MINQPTPVARVVHVLTDETWNKAKRNTAARHIAAMREPDTDEAVIQRTYPILQQGVVGRYDRRRAELLRVIAEASGCSAFVNSESFHYQGSRRKYSVTMFGRESDIARSIELYKALMATALAHMMEITGENVGPQRSRYFESFIGTISRRLNDVGTAPSVKDWIQAHHRDAYSAREKSGQDEIHRELA
jgi:hypothetical protein